MFRDCSRGWSCCCCSGGWWLGRGVVVFHGAVIDSESNDFFVIPSIQNSKEKREEAMRMMRHAGLPAEGGSIN